MKSLFERPSPTLLDLLPWDELVAEGVLRNVDGGLVSTFSFRGPDLEAAEAEEIEALSRALDRVLTPLGDGWMLHLEVERLPAPGYPPRGAFPDPFTAALDEERRRAYEGAGGHFQSEAYLTFTYRDPSKGRSRWGRRPYDPEAEARALASFGEELEELAALLAPHLALRPLGSREMLRYLHGALTFRHQPLNLPPYPISLETLFGSGPWVLGQEIRVDDLHVVPIDVSGFPATSNPSSLDFLNHLALAYHAVWRFLPLDRHTARGAVERRRVHWSAASLKPAQLLAQMLYGSGKREQPVDDAFGSAMARELDQVLFYLEEHDTSLGFLTTTLLTFGPDRGDALEDAQRVVAELRNRGFLARVETVNAAQSFLGALPGVGAYNQRRPLVVNRTFIDLALTSAVWPGSPVHPALAPEPAQVVAASSGSTPFFLSLAHGDVQHALIVGPTGAGKSVLVNFLVHQFLRYPGAQVLAIDKGLSLYAATLAAGGCHYALAPDGGGEEGLEEATSRFAPLAHLESAADLQAASSWLLELLSLQGLAPTPERVHALDEGLRLLQVAPNRTLGTFASKVQDRAIRQALEPYGGSGRLSYLFDGSQAPLRQGPLHVFEMEAVLPLAARAVVPLVLHLFAEIERRLDGRPTLLVVEEALPYLSDTLWSERFATWLYQLRKANAGVVFVGQSLAAFLESSLKHALLESCPTRIFLPNPAARQEEAARAYRAFGLGGRQIEILSEALAKRDYFAVTPEGSRLFHLELSPAALAVYGLAGPEARRTVGAYRREHGPRWLEAYLGAQGHADFLDLYRQARTDLASPPLPKETSP